MPQASSGLQTCFPHFVQVFSSSGQDIWVLSLQLARNRRALWPEYLINARPRKLYIFTTFPMGFYGEYWLSEAHLWKLPSPKVLKFKTTNIYVLLKQAKSPNIKRRKNCMEIRVHVYPELSLPAAHPMLRISAHSTHIYQYSCFFFLSGKASS